MNAIARSTCRKIRFRVRKSTIDFLGFRFFQFLAWDYFVIVQFHMGEKMSEKKGWPRNSYIGPGGGLYIGPGGGLYIGPGGGASIGPGGGMSIGPGGGMSIGPGGGLSIGPGGGLSIGPGGGLSIGPGGGMSIGPGGGLYLGPGGGLYAGPDSEPYYSIIPPREAYLEELLKFGYKSQYAILKKAWNL
jgi:hypothetical protein